MKNKYIKAATFFCAAIAFAISLNAGEMGQDASYIGEQLDLKPDTLLLDDGHPLVNDLDGQRMTVYYQDPNGVGGTIVCDFVDGHYIEFTDGISGSFDDIVKVPYVMFRIREGVYFVTWVENRAVQAPPPDVNWDTYEPKWYGEDGDYQTSLILDLENGLMTDAYIAPNHTGAMKFHLFQSRITLAPIPTGISLSEQIRHTKKTKGGK